MSIERIIELCEERKINYEHLEARNRLVIFLPKARDYKKIVIRDDVANYLISENIDILKYRTVSGYEAIWSTELETLECEIELPHRAFIFDRFFSSNPELIENGKITFNTAIDGVTAELSMISRELLLITMLQMPERFGSNFGSVEGLIRRQRYSTSIKINGLNVGDHEKAREIIQKLCYSICFQLDCKMNIAVMPSIERNLENSRFSRGSVGNLMASSVCQSYDPEALSLYWYAQSALSMPLLKYLALYQVVEFYYPMFSDLAIQKRVSNLIKDPSFNVFNDNDVAKICNLVKVSSSARSELSQLEATIRECVDANSLREWFNDDPERSKYFTSKEAKRLSSFVIKSDSNDEDILKQVWQRFYNIRCRIVHTKGSNSELDVLHPRSQEVEHLFYDIELANYLAHRVLIASSKPIGSV